MSTRTTRSLVMVDRLFNRTKLMCFGRYAVDLPRETEQVLGFHEIEGGFHIYPVAQFPDSATLLEDRFREFRLTFRHAEMLSAIQDGPVAGAKFFWMYADGVEKAKDMRVLRRALHLGTRLYAYAGIAAPRGYLPPTERLARMTTLMRGMRAWDGVEVPLEPGVCIEGAFIHEPTHRFQEIMSSGFYFPSLPDVSFSVTSNKNASTDGPNGRGLLESVEMARGNPLLALVGGYPYTFLRKGKRTLHGLWDGEEIVSRSNRDHALRFEWGMVGQTGNPARPAHLEVRMSTRVANNRVGASATTSLSDEEAVALWDRLLEGVKFRVAVPGATAQSVALR